MAARVSLALAATLLVALLPVMTPSAAQQGEPATATATATLSVLAGAVQRVPAGSGQPEVAVDGSSLAAGDRVLTGPGATALITFLDGSTLTVQPESDVTVKTAEIDGQGRRSIIGIRINLGTVWARIVRLLDPGSSFSLESNAATAVAVAGRIGGQQSADGSFVCWTTAGELTVRGADGQTLLTLQPGQATTVQPGQAPAPRPFSIHQSTLEIAASPGVLPLVQMPDGARVAGYVAPGVEVNQVFGSSSEAPADGGHTLTLPAGEPGPFTLVLQGQRDGPFSVQVVGRYQGRQVYQQELAGTIKKDERLSTHVTQQVEPPGGDPKTIRVTDGAVAPLQPFGGPLPGKILLGPSELRAAGGSAPDERPRQLLTVGGAAVLIAALGGLLWLRSRRARPVRPATSG